MNRSFNKVVGTGGIGTGMLFLSIQNETLGRSESRLVELSDAKDYCKQHIVLYYTTQLLLGQAAVFPIGYVGADAMGEALLKDLKEIGMQTEYVGKSTAYGTMLSICLQYPDKEGCNFTATNNATQCVTPSYIRECMEQIGIDSHTAVAAIPEVSLEARKELLQIGHENKALCAASVPMAEAADFVQAGMVELCDILAVNEEEAIAMASALALSDPSDFNALYDKLRQINPEIMLLITLGKNGALTFYNGNTEKVPPLATKVVNTTGAGDACLGGMLAGLICGYPFQKGCDDRTFGETKLCSAVELGTLCAGIAVGFEDSIARFVTRENLEGYIQEKGWETNWQFGPGK